MSRAVPMPNYSVRRNVLAPGPAQGTALLHFPRMDEHGAYRLNPHGQPDVEMIIGVGTWEPTITLMASGVIGGTLTVETWQASAVVADAPSKEAIYAHAGMPARPALAVTPPTRPAKPVVTGWPAHLIAALPDIAALASAGIAPVTPGKEPIVGGIIPAPFAGPMLAHPDIQALATQGRGIIPDSVALKLFMFMRNERQRGVVNAHHEKREGALVASASDYRKAVEDGKIAVPISGEDRTLPKWRQSTHGGNKRRAGDKPETDHFGPVEHAANAVRKAVATGLDRAYIVRRQAALYQVTVSDLEAALDRAPASPAKRAEREDNWQRGLNSERYPRKGCL